MARKKRTQNELTVIPFPKIMTKTCPECKKKFDWYGGQWVYRKNRKNGSMLWFCSYKCWRAEDHRKEARGKSLLRGGNYAGI